MYGLIQLKCDTARERHNFGVGVLSPPLVYEYMRNVCSLTNGKDLFPAVDDERSWCREKRNIEKALCPADENDKKEKEPEGKKKRYIQASTRRNGIKRDTDILSICRVVLQFLDDSFHRYRDLRDK